MPHLSCSRMSYYRKVKRTNVYSRLYFTEAEAQENLFKHTFSLNTRFYSSDEVKKQKIRMELFRRFNLNYSEQTAQDFFDSAEIQSLFTSFFRLHYEGMSKYSLFKLFDLFSVTDRAIQKPFSHSAKVLLKIIDDEKIKEKIMSEFKVFIKKQPKDYQKEPEIIIDEFIRPMEQNTQQTEKPFPVRISGNKDHPIKPSRRKSSLIKSSHILDYDADDERIVERERYT